MLLKRDKEHDSYMLRNQCTEILNLVQSSMKKGSYNYATSRGHSVSRDPGGLERQREAAEVTSFQKLVADVQGSPERFNNGDNDRTPTSKLGKEDKFFERDRPIRRNLTLEAEESAGSDSENIESRFAKRGNKITKLQAVIKQKDAVIEGLRLRLLELTQKLDMEQYTLRYPQRNIEWNVELVEGLCYFPSEDYMRRHNRQTQFPSADPVVIPDTRKHSGQLFIPASEEPLHRGNSLFSSVYNLQRNESRESGRSMEGIFHQKSRGDKKITKDLRYMFEEYYSTEGQPLNERELRELKLRHMNSVGERGTNTYAKECPPAKDLIIHLSQGSKFSDNVTGKSKLSVGDQLGMPSSELESQNQNKVEDGELYPESQHNIPSPTLSKKQSQILDKQALYDKQKELLKITVQQSQSLMNQKSQVNQLHKNSSLKELSSNSNNDRVTKNSPKNLPKGSTKNIPKPAPQAKPTEDQSNQITIHNGSVEVSVAPINMSTKAEEKDSKFQNGQPPQSSAKKRTQSDMKLFIEEITQSALNDTSKEASKPIDSTKMIKLSDYQVGDNPAEENQSQKQSTVKKSPRGRPSVPLNPPTGSISNSTAKQLIEQGFGASFGRGARPTPLHLKSHQSSVDEKLKQECQNEGSYFETFEQAIQKSKLDTSLSNQPRSTLNSSKQRGAQTKNAAVLLPTESLNSISRDQLQAGTRPRETPLAMSAEITGSAVAHLDEGMATAAFANGFRGMVDHHDESEHREGDSRSHSSLKEEEDEEIDVRVPHELESEADYADNDRDEEELLDYTELYNNKNQNEEDFERGEDILEGQFDATMKEANLPSKETHIYQQHSKEEDPDVNLGSKTPSAISQRKAEKLKSSRVSPLCIVESKRGNRTSRDLQAQKQIIKETLSPFHEIDHVAKEFIITNNFKYQEELEKEDKESKDNRANNKNRYNLEVPAPKLNQHHFPIDKKKQTGKNLQIYPGGIPQNEIFRTDFTTESNAIHMTTSLEDAAEEQIRQALKKQGRPLHVDEDLDNQLNESTLKVRVKASQITKTLPLSGEFPPTLLRESQSTPHLILPNQAQQQQVQESASGPHLKNKPFPRGPSPSPSATLPRTHSQPKTDYKDLLGLVRHNRSKSVINMNKDQEEIVGNPGKKKRSPSCSKNENQANHEHMMEQQKIEQSRAFYIERGMNDEGADQEDRFRQRHGSFLTVNSPKPPSMNQSITPSMRRHLKFQTNLCGLIRHVEINLVESSNSSSEGEGQPTFSKPSFVNSRRVSQVSAKSKIGLKDKGRKYLNNSNISKDQKSQRMRTERVKTERIEGAENSRNKENNHFHPLSEFRERDRLNIISPPRQATPLGKRKVSNKDKTPLRAPQNKVVVQVNIDQYQEKLLTEKQASSKEDPKMKPSPLRQRTETRKASQTMQKLVTSGDSFLGVHLKDIPTARQGEAELQTDRSNGYALKCKGSPITSCKYKSDRSVAGKEQSKLLDISNNVGTKPKQDKEFEKSLAPSKIENHKNSFVSQNIDRSNLPKEKERGSGNPNSKMNDTFYSAHDSIVMMHEILVDKVSDLQLQLERSSGKKQRTRPRLIKNN
jgi:hypothetical protein